MKNILRHSGRLSDGVRQRDRAVTFALNLGRALHTYGVPAHRLERALSATCDALGLVGDFFSTPTLILASFGAGDGQQTYVVRTEPGAVDLAKLAALEEVADAVCAGSLSIEEGDERIRSVVAAPPQYGRLITMAAYLLASAASCVLLGGGFIEVAVAAFIGMMSGGVALAMERSGTAVQLFTLVAATFASFVAASVAATIEPIAVGTATLAGLIVLVPGLTLTVAVTELATRNLVSGTARVMAAAVDFIMIGFGVAMGSMCAHNLFGVAPVVAPTALHGVVQILAVVVAPLSFVVLFRAAPRDFGWVLLAGGLGYAGARMGWAVLGPDLGTTVGAFVVGVMSAYYARRLQRPTSVILVPGIMLLVPGSIGFRSVTALIDRDVVAGLETAVSMVLVAVSLAAGLLLAHVLAPARRV